MSGSYAQPMMWPKNFGCGLQNQPQELFSVMMDFQMDAFSNYMKAMTYGNTFNSMVMWWRNNMNPNQKKEEIG